MCNYDLCFCVFGYWLVLRHSILFFPFRNVVAVRTGFNTLHVAFCAVVGLEENEVIPLIITIIIISTCRPQEATICVYTCLYVCFDVDGVCTLDDANVVP